MPSIFSIQAYPMIACDCLVDLEFVYPCLVSQHIQELFIIEPWWGHIRCRIIYLDTDVIVKGDVRWLKDVKNGAAFARNWSETGYYKQFYHVLP